MVARAGGMVVGEELWGARGGLMRLIIDCASCLLSSAQLPMALRMMAYRSYHRQCDRPLPV